MRIINKITNGSKQKFILIGEAGEKINFYLYFMPSQRSWFFDISYGTFTANGLKVSCSPNMLRKFRNKITFGMSCIAVDDYDPRDINDFVNGRVVLRLLNSADVDELERIFFTA